VAIDDGCVIESGTKIWYFLHALKGALIVERCKLDQNVLS